MSAIRSAVERIAALGGPTLPSAKNGFPAGAPLVVWQAMQAMWWLAGPRAPFSGTASTLLQVFDPWKEKGWRGVTVTTCGVAADGAPWELRPGLDHFDGNHAAQQAFTAQALRNLAGLFLAVSRISPLSERAAVVAEACNAHSIRTDLIRADLEGDVEQARAAWMHRYNFPADLTDDMRVVLADAAKGLGTACRELHEAGLVWATGFEELLGDIDAEIPIAKVESHLRARIPHTGGSWFTNPNSAAFIAQLAELSGHAPYRYIGATMHLYGVVELIHHAATGTWAPKGDLFGRMNEARHALDKIYGERGGLSGAASPRRDRADVVRNRLALVGQEDLVEATISADRLLAAARPVRLLVVGPRGCGARRVARTLANLHRERHKNKDEGAALIEPDHHSWHSRSGASAAVRKAFTGTKDSVVYVRGLGEQVGAPAGDVVLDTIDHVISQDTAPAAVIAEISESDLVQLLLAAPNLLRRFELVRTEPFTDPELGELARQLAEEAGWALSSEAATQMLIECHSVRPTATFCNARIVEHLVHRAGTTAVLDGRSNIIASDFVAAESPMRIAQPVLDETLEELDRFIGLDDLKSDIQGLAAEATFWASRREQNLPGEIQPTRHMVFTGEPGTAKTTIARLIGRIYAALGLLKTGQVVEVTRPDLVAQYIGQTAPKVRDMVGRALGGVLFIDEAYSLYQPDNPRDFGPEAITELLRCMEEHRDELIVIIAGYSDEIDVFLSANPGLSSRFPKRWHFPRYTPEQLVDIFKMLANTNGVPCGAGVETAVRSAVVAAMDEPDFGNGRTVRNIFEAAVERAARRAGRAGSSTLQIAAEDVPSVDGPPTVGDPSPDPSRWVELPTG